MNVWENFCRSFPYCATANNQPAEQAFSQSIASASLKEARNHVVLRRQRKRTAKVEQAAAAHAGAVVL